MNVIDEWIDSDGAKRDALKFKHACDSLDSLRYCTFIIGRRCGKTELAKELARQMLNSTYGLASADNWAQRYLYTTDKVYDTLGIKDYLNKVYGDPMLKFKNGNYINWDINLASYDDDKLKELFKAPDIVDLVNQIIRKEEESMIENRTKLGEWTFRGDTFVTGRRAVFGAVIHTTVYASKSALRFAFHPVENSSYVIVVVCKYCDFENRCELRDSFFAKVNTDTHHKLAIHDNYPNNLALKNIGLAYKKWLREEDEPMKNLQYFNRRFIKDVIFHDPATIVEWEDGSKTVVKTQDGEHYDPEKGLAMAIAKKAMGNKRDYYNVFKHYLKKVETESVFGKDVKVLVIPASIEKDVIEFLQWKDKERIDAEFAKSQADKEE